MNELNLIIEVARKNAKTQRKESPAGSSLRLGVFARNFMSAATHIALIALVRVYQLTLSPALQLLFGPCCRFQPSCSHYFIQAVRKYGPLRGSMKGVSRLCRCHPFCAGGYDPP